MAKCHICENDKGEKCRLCEKNICHECRLAHRNIHPEEEWQRAEFADSLDDSAETAIERIRQRYSGFDAGKKFKIKIKTPRENRNCMCGEVLKGLITPPECGLFGKSCTPENPVGACMVSSEGTCAAHYKYRGFG